VTSLKSEVDRLIRGLDEALEQQAATAEVLAAINNSGFDLDRILQARPEVRVSVPDQGNTEKRMHLSSRRRHLLRQDRYVSK
jgi:hypothetical protein